LIFDNYNDPSQFEFYDYFPPVSHGAVVVTIRRLDFVGSTLYIMPLYSVKDSLAILKPRSNRDDVQLGMLSENIVRVSEELSITIRSICQQIALLSG
jgi:hypothetical protein